MNKKLLCIMSCEQADLVSTIGESAAMGTAGVVIWGKSETKTEVYSDTSSYTHKYICTHCMFTDSLVMFSDELFLI